MAENDNNTPKTKTEKEFKINAENGSWAVRGYDVKEERIPDHGTRLVITDADDKTVAAFDNATKVNETELK